jgi:hypothetical protein
MGQLHSKNNVYSSQCPNTEDYDIVYESIQMCVYCNANEMAWITKNPHQGMFYY